MTIAFNWYTKQTFTQEEAAKTLSDITINHTVTGLVISDAAGADLDIDITDGHGRCEGWRVVLSGSHVHTMVAASGDTTYYVYLELTKSGEKVTAVTITEYTTPQTTTDRIYLGTVVTASSIVSTATSLVNTYAFEGAKVRISGSTTLDDWKDGTDPTKISGAEIYTGTVPYAALNLSNSVVNADINSSAAIAWSKIAVDGNVTYDNVAETITAAWSVRGTQLNFHDGSNNCGNITTNTDYLVLRNGNNQNIITFPRDGADSTRIKSLGVYDIELTTVTGDIVMTAGGDIIMNHPTVSWLELFIEVNPGGTVGGVFPQSHESGSSGRSGEAWRQTYARTVKYGAGGSSSYSHREDMKDLRAIKEYVDDKGKPVKVGDHGDPVWDARTIPEYIRDKQSLKDMTKKGKSEMAYLDMGNMVGWIISIFKKLDETDLAHKEELIMLHDEIELLKKQQDPV